MVVGVTKIPWFSYSPFHAALGILTTRMLINLRKASMATEISGGSTNAPTAPDPSTFQARVLATQLSDMQFNSSGQDSTFMGTDSVGDDVELARFETHGKPSSYWEDDSPPPPPPWNEKPRLRQERSSLTPIAFAAPNSHGGISMTAQHDSIRLGAQFPTN